MADELVEPEGCPAPEADDGGPADLVGSPEQHLHNLLEGPAAGYVAESAYLFPVACIVGFKFMPFSAANQSSTGLPEYEYGAVYMVLMFLWAK